MSCHQISGVLLKLSCSNEISGSCEQCQKEVCTTHLHRLNTQKLCEDCYWENFLYAKQKSTEQFISDNYEASKAFVYNSNTNASESAEGFTDGFGGGKFGGAGAGGSWTEGDAQSFNKNAQDSPLSQEALGGAILTDQSNDLGGFTPDDADDTFYYS